MSRLNGQTETAQTAAPRDTSRDASRDGDVEQLKAHVAALEELLEVYERETLEKSSRLEKALQELNHYTQQLACAESTLQVLKSILSSMGDAVLVVDETGQFILLNPAAQETLGLGATDTCLTDWIAEWTETYGLYLPDRTTPFPLAEFPLIQAMQGHPTTQTEVFVRLPNRTDSVCLSVTARSLKDEQDNLRGAVAVFHNITPIKQAEIALRQSELQSREQATTLKNALHQLGQTQAQLVQTEKMASLGQLVAGIAHEINNPINFIHGNIKPAEVYIQDLLYLLQLYHQHYPNPVPTLQASLDEIDVDFIAEDLPKLVRSLKLGTERICQIVLSLRNFSRLDEAEIKSVNIHDGIDSTLLILQNRLKAKSGRPEITMIKRYGNLPPIECYAGQLNQVFMNILCNGIDALEESFGPNAVSPEADLPTLTIYTEQIATNQIRIGIHNNRSSIQPASQARLFDPFFTTKPVGQGTGLGLYISYQIVTEKHHGVLRCLSQPDTGVEFQIEIPIHQP